MRSVRSTRPKDRRYDVWHRLARQGLAPALGEGCHLGIPAEHVAKSLVLGLEVSFRQLVEQLFELLTRSHELRC